tara:strand:+ start:1755 stop:2801 length:1047 start_codon:yes stop_codon:yes gene_type:complete
MKILMLSEGCNGCSLYRLEMPRDYLTGHCVDLVYHIPPVTEMLSYDFLVIQKAVDTQLLRVLRKYQIPYVYEMDDDLFNVPTWNPAHGFYSARKGIVKDFLRSARGVTVTTSHLQRLVQSCNRNAQVLPNCIDPPRTHIATPLSPLLPNMTRITMSQYQERIRNKVVIGWAGSPTHRQDLRLVIPALKRIAQEYRRRVHIVMGGATLRELVKLMPADILTLLEMVPAHQYPGLVRSAQWDIGLAPVTSHMFNRSKSNLKVIEYMASGCVPVASESLTYSPTLKGQGAGILCTTDEEWYQAMSSLIEGSKVRKAFHRAGKALVESKYNIAHNIVRWEDFYRSIYHEIHR